MMHILVVEDDANLRLAVQIALQRDGYEVQEAGDGQQALQRIADGLYDAAIVDFQIPPPDGLEVLKQLHAYQPRCVRILMSGALDLPVVMHAVNRGEVSRIIAKPFHLGEIQTTVKEAIGARTRLEELCVGVRHNGFELQRRHLEECFSGELLRLALQPIVEAETGNVHGYEALLRSRHGVLDTPMKVIAAAESHGMLGRLGDWVASAAARWLRDPSLETNLFVNVHPNELGDFTQAQRRFEILKPWSDRVVVEITERGNVLELSEWQQAIEWLSQSGFRIAVDDLGAGYNSLAVLAELQPEFMKVDMSIVRHIDREERKQRLVDLLACFAKATHSRLVLEGIETHAEAEVARRLGADLLQGYLLGRPAFTLSEEPVGAGCR